MPRIPDHPITATARHDGIGSCARNRLLKTRGKYVAGKTQISAHDDDHNDDHQAVERVVAHVRLQFSDDRRQFQADQQKCERVEHVGEHAPDRRPDQPRLGVDEQPRPPTEHDAGRDRGQHAGDVQLVGRQIGGERREQKYDARIVGSPKPRRCR